MAYTIYLSSTLKDLLPERDAVRRALTGNAVKESYKASETSLIDTCLDDVASCDLYVLIVGLRYGYQPKAELQNPLNLSITELEYQRAVDKNIPRLVFIKTEESIRATYTDALTKEVDPELIARFRKRVGDGARQTPALFGDPDKLALAVVTAFSDFKSKREKGSEILGWRSNVLHPAELRTDLIVICAAGTDSPTAASINARSDARFRASEISPDDPQLLLSLDRQVRTARAAALLLTRSSLPRFTKKGLLEAALRAIACRSGRAFLLLDQVAEQDLPPSWLNLPDAKVIPVPATGIADAAGNAWVRCHMTVREHTPWIANDRRIGVPCLLVALTDAKVADFRGEKASLFSGFAQAHRDTRETQFNTLKRAVQQSYPNWPEKFYGERTRDWHPFGPNSQSIGELLDRAFARINSDQRPGSRERRLLRDFRLQPQHYSFEDYCVDQWGSRAMLEEVRDRGCLLLLDELVLLHPSLREHLDSFLSGQRIAIVSANPCDPAYLSTRDLLDDFSHLKVGALFARFRDQEDPRCELSLNSPARLQRWLRFVLPELAMALSDEESQPELVARGAELLELTGAP